MTVTDPSSAEQIFAHVQRIHERAVRLLSFEAPVGEPLPREHGVDATAGAPGALRLSRLAATFRLPPLAVDMLLCLVAFEFDPFLRRLLQASQREAGRPWLELGTIADLLGEGATGVPELARLIDGAGPLGRYALVEVEHPARWSMPLACTRLKVARRVAMWLVGDDTLPAALTLHAPRDLLGQALVPAATTRVLVARLDGAITADEALVVEVTGGHGVGKRFYCAGVAGHFDLPLLVLDARKVDAEELHAELYGAQREARLAGALLCVAHWDVHIAEVRPAGSSGDPDAPRAEPRRHLPPVLARFIEEHEGVLFLTGDEREPLLEHHARQMSHVVVPLPAPSHRASLLGGALERVGLTPEPGIDLQSVARRIALAPAHIELAARVAGDLASDRDPDSRVVKYPELVEACQRQLGHDLKSLAVRVTATHRWEDLVIPVDVYHALREMIDYVAQAHRVYDEWGFGARHSLSRGISALFAGPPGTGKTMCASVIARELDMELFRVDLSRVVSKWIGETEKNLGRVFDEAQHSNAIILFDEADSLFAKRTEVKSSVDRYANLEVNYLLQRIEAFGGVTVLTTNFEDTIDSAFKRRLTFRMRFEKPDAEARAALWRKVFPAECAVADDLDYARLGQLFDFSGGNIRNAALRSAFLSAAEGHPVDMRTIMTAAEREGREMGVLTRALNVDGTPVVNNAPVEGEDDSGEALEAHDVAERLRSSGARLVPITHPRTPR